MELTELIDTDYITVAATDTVPATAETMIGKNKDYVLVLEEQRIKGIVTQQDIAQAVAHTTDLSSLTCQDIMSESLITLQSDAHLIDAIRGMQENAVQHLLILSENGMTGVLALRDIIEQNALVQISAMQRLASLADEGGS